MAELLPNLTLHDRILRVASERFVESFSATWQRIPEGARKIIADYFELHPGHVYLCFKMDFGDLPIEPLGRIAPFAKGTVFTFLAPYIQHAEDKGADGVIAHEFAHCHNRGAGTWTANEDEEEANTRRLAESWGFVSTMRPSSEFMAEIERWRLRYKAAAGRNTEKRLYKRLASGGGW